MASFEPPQGGETDWGTTIVAACSFLLHFGAAASLYGDWTDPVVGDDSSIAHVIESLQLAAAPEVEHPTNAPTRGESAAPGIESRARPAEESGATTTKGMPSARDAGRLTDARAHALAGALERLNLEIAGVLDAHGSPVDGVLRGEAPIALLDGVAESAAGAERGTTLHLGDTRGVIQPGAKRAPVIGDVGPAGPMTAGTASPVRAPTGRAHVEPPAQGGGAVSDAPAVVARLAAGFRRCYQRGLDIDPTMRGSVSLRARIGPNGEVQSVQPTSTVGLSGDVVSCIAGKVSGALFAPPTTGAATLVIPVKLVPQ